MTKKVILTQSWTRPDINTTFFPSSGYSTASHSYQNPVEISNSMSDDSLTTTNIRKYFVEDFITYMSNALSSDKDQVLAIDTYHAENSILSNRSITYIEE
jgi:hypothetical protein